MRIHIHTSNGLRQLQNLNLVVESCCVNFGAHGGGLGHQKVGSDNALLLLQTLKLEYSLLTRQQGAQRHPAGVRGAFPTTLTQMVVDSVLQISEDLPRPPILIPSLFTKRCK